QAEDGIRDFHVTGVQTCALPISMLVREKTTNDLTVVEISSNIFQKYLYKIYFFFELLILKFFKKKGKDFSLAFFGSPISGHRSEIGRASCRERVYVQGGDDECAV